MFQARLVVVVLSLAIAVSCVGRPFDETRGVTVVELQRRYAQALDKDVDILFIVDSSGSMDDEQAALAKNFPQLIEALRVPELGNRLPNVHIGVITPDLGVPGGGLDRCSQNGDGARLRRPTTCGASLPTDAYITYDPDSNQTNIPGSGDPIQRVKDAFSCMAKVGTSGCGFEQQLEAARRALDPELNINPGFLRPGARLVLVFITDEDDCSAHNATLYSEAHTGPLGPLHSFRCFEFGFTCNINDRTVSGPRTECTPRSDYLHDVQTRYVEFFKRLKPQGRTIVANIATPTGRIEVRYGADDKQADLVSPCPGNDDAKPALRLEAFSKAFNKEGSFDSICSGDFSAPLARLGERIVANLGGQCVPGALLDGNGGLVCRAGDALGPAASGAACQQSCLQQASCTVTDVAPDGAQTALARCAPAQFDDPNNTSCGETCPCWRIVPRAECGKNGSPPYGFEILRREEAPVGTTATFRCRGALAGWTSPEVLDIAQCQK
ncbi:MAG: VWA domain-containing protein [Myxococcales bacterium]|nr:VWA domain-containing protein [Myxococcales bacterium]